MPNIIFVKIEAFDYEVTERDVQHALDKIYPNMPTKVTALPVERLTILSETFSGTMNSPALDEVLTYYRDTLGVKSERANQIHRQACQEVSFLRHEHFLYPICAPEYHKELDEAGDRFCKVCGQRLITNEGR